MKVYIRYESEGTAGRQYFCDWQPDKMDELIYAIERSGGVTGEGGNMYGDLYHQFIVEGGVAGAEIVINDVPD